MKKLFIFNPDCEMAIANGSKYYMPSGNIVQMMEDLAFLPAWLGEEGDFVLVKNEPDKKFKEGICRPLKLACQAVTGEKIGSFAGLTGEPWGWSPKICHWLTQRGMKKEWKPERKEWYSRKMACEGLKKLLKVLPFVKSEVVPKICYSIEEIQEYVWEQESMVKAPWSSSGRGILTLQNQILPKEKEWLGGILKRQGYLMLEKKLKKVEDYAMEFYAGEKGVQFIGWSAFHTGERGEYKGNYIGPQEKIEERLSACLGKSPVRLLKQEMPQMLGKLLTDYRGFLGVDMMIYKDETEQLCLQPCVEINLRYNMGIIALFISRNYVLEEIEGEFTIRFYSDKGKAQQENSFFRQAYPVIYKNNRIQSGYLNLTPVTDTTHFVASIHCY